MAAAPTFNLADFRDLGNLAVLGAHLTGTIFENTNKPLKDWLRVARA
jgi:hypothetical protein